jgi:hypothetical protein
LEKYLNLARKTMQIDRRKKDKERMEGMKNQSQNKKQNKKTE